MAWKAAFVPNSYPLCLKWPISKRVRERNGLRQGYLSLTQNIGRTVAARKKAAKEKAARKEATRTEGARKKEAARKKKAREGERDCRA